MSENWPITEEGILVIRKKYGVFDFKKLYKLGKIWAEENKYSWHEKLFTDKVSSLGHEIEVEWEFTKKFSAFVKFQIEVKIWILRMNPVKSGEKNLEKGEVEITIKSEMQMDYRINWEKKAFLKLLRHIYIHYVKKRYFNKVAGALWVETYDLQDKIKEILEQFTR